MGSARESASRYASSASRVSACTAAAVVVVVTSTILYIWTRNNPVRSVVAAFVGCGVERNLSRRQANGNLEIRPDAHSSRVLGQAPRNDDGAWPLQRRHDLWGARSGAP